MIKVSAIVSLYNSLEFVEGCLQDLVEQTLFTRGELEIVVIDSNSPQNEREVVERFQQRYPNIRYARTSERETLYQAWNRGVDLAEGRYLTNANSDDRHHIECLEVLARELDSNPDIDLVYADVFESREPNQTFRNNPGNRRYTYASFFAPMSLLNYQFGCQPMWRKSVHGVIGPFSKSYKAAGDWDFCLRFSLAGLRARHIPHVLGSFLQRDASISTRDDTSHREQAEIYTNLTEESILTLYGHEGFPLDTARDRARAFTDFAHRASSLVLPWDPAQTYLEPRAALMCCLAAFNLDREDPRIAWNLGVSLHRASHRQEAVPFLQKGVYSNDPKIFDAISAFRRGEPVELPLVSV